MSYTRLSRKPLLFKSFTGLSISEFDVISREIESRYEEHERKRLSKRRRQRDVGAGRPFKLRVKERFLMLLVYYRLYITYTLSGFLFDLDQSNICRDMSIIEPLVKLCIPLPKKLYKRTRRLRTIDEVEEEYFLVSRHLLTLQNKESQGQLRTKGEGRVTTLAKRRNILSRHNIW